MAVICTIKVGRVQPETSLESNESTMEIDNAADKTVLFSNCLPIHDFGILMNVSGWDVSAGSVECPTIYVAILYDHPIIGQVYMLV